MGYKEWRQRQLDRADAMTAWADKTEGDLAEKQEARVQEQAAREARGERDWLEARASRLGEDHDDLVARAKAVGMDEYAAPAPGLADRVTNAADKLRVLVPFSSLLVSFDGGDGGSQSPDAYESWRDRILIEEAAAAKVARGEQLNRRDRAVLKLARFTSK